MKRRKFLVSSLWGLGLVVGGHQYLVYRHPLTFKSCPKIASATSTSLWRFAAIADFGTGDANQYLVAKIMSCDCDRNHFPLVLLAGDNIYEHGEIEKIDTTFEIPYRELLQQDVKFYAALGNHDIRTNNGEDQIRYAGFNMNGRYYSFTRQPVRFFALDTNPEAPWQEQLDWLERELANAKQPWKAVFGHHQIYASGKRGVNRELAEKLIPLLSRYGVQLYINGHEHHYERTRLIEGTTYLTCGIGAKLREVGKSDWTASSVSRLGFAIVEVYRDRLEMLGIGTNGKVFDRGKISLDSIRENKINIMRILLVEDDDRIAKPLAEGLKNEHHVVEIARDGVEGWEYAQGAEFDLILLDLMLPKLDGISLCKRLRQASSKALILMLTAKDTTDDKVIGLDAGADDYLVKPFKLKELAARIRALSRRCYELKPQVLTYGLLQLDPSTGEVTYDGNLLALTPKEYLILEYFLRHPRQIMTRTAILDKLWEFDKLSGEGTIKTHITNLRSKLKAAGSEDNLIETVYGIGYRLGSLES